MNGLPQIYAFDETTENGNADTAEAHPLVSDPGGLGEQARRLMLAGILPLRPPDRMWGGAGSGAQCPVCGAPVKPEQTGLEIEHKPHDGADISNLHFHVACYAAVETERDRLQQESRAAGTLSPFGVAARTDRREGA